MSKNRAWLNIIWRALLSILLIIVMLLSLNSLLPLKRHFPQWRLSPHLGELKEETPDGIRTQYINGNDDITVALDKNYAAVIKTLDQNGNCVLEQYFDKHGKPAVTANGSYALQKEYDSEGRWVCATYLDANLKPSLSTYGYASIRRTYNDIGKVEKETYFDTDGMPTMDLTKKYGVRYEYDSEKRTASTTYIDADGHAMNSKSKFAIVRYTYASDGTLYMEMYYDAEGNPAELSDGQCGYIHENGRLICVDRDGNRMFVLRLFLFRSIFAVLAAGILLLLLILCGSRALTWLLLLLYLAFMVYMTFVNREAGSSVITWHIPPNYYLFWANKEVLSNIWLFIPLGAILYKLSHMWEIIALPIALTLCIEFTQLMLDVGAFEISDLVANSLGGIIGVVVCYLLEPAVNYIRRRVHE